MLLSRSGAATAVYAIAIIIVIAAAAGAYLFVIAPMSGGTTPAASTQGSASSTLPSTSSSAQITTSTASSSTTSTSPTFMTSTSTTTYHTTSAITFSTTYSTSSGTSCTTTSTTSSGQDQVLNFSQTFAEYSEIAEHFNGTYNGNGVDATYDYNVVLATATTYQVNVTVNSGATTIHYTDYVLKNGTAAAVYYSGQNYTGYYASALFFTTMAPYYLGNVFASQDVFGALVASNLIHPTGASTLTLGPTEVMVTDYAPYTLPVSENQCGSSAYFTRFSLELGNVTGESLKLLTSMNITGSITTSGTTESLDLSLQITSVTKSA